MKLLLKVCDASERRMNGEYDLDSSDCVKGHLDRWEEDMRDANISGRLVVGYYSFGKHDREDGTFHRIESREIKNV